MQVLPSRAKLDPGLGSACPHTCGNPNVGLRANREAAGPVSTHLTGSGSSRQRGAPVGPPGSPLRQSSRSRGPQQGHAETRRALPGLRSARRTTQSGSLLRPWRTRGPMPAGTGSITFIKTQPVLQMGKGLGGGRGSDPCLVSLNDGKLAPPSSRPGGTNSTPPAGRGRAGPGPGGRRHMSNCAIIAANKKTRSLGAERRRYLYLERALLM